MHLRKLLEELRRVTGGDPLKAKQLADLLSLRVHAGEHRLEREVHKSEKLKQDDNNANQAIVSSIFWFVQAMHNAGGSGRYPHKIREAQQVLVRQQSVKLQRSQSAIPL